MRKGNPPLRVAVVGGSIGGLCTAIALRGVGCAVDVYERAPGVLASRGAGIVVQDDLQNLLVRHGASELPAIACFERRYLVPDGGDGVATATPHRFSSWSAIHGTVRALFPDEHYHPGFALTGFEETDGRMVARFAERGEVEADLLICADGSHSETRRRLLPEVEPHYAGYVAWRGTVDEELASPELIKFFDRSLTFCEGRSSGHILCYFIPGTRAAIEPGRRRLNWVWYVSVPEGPELERLLTDRTGALRAASVPAGMVAAELVAGVRAAAARELHPRFVELVERTPEPFIQMIIDVAVPRMHSDAPACSETRRSCCGRMRRRQPPRLLLMQRRLPRLSQPIRTIPLELCEFGKQARSSMDIVSSTMASPSARARFSGARPPPARATSATG